MAADLPQETLQDVVATGDTRRSLEALRDRLAAELEVASGSAVAALAKQLADVLKAIAGLPSAGERTLDDELARRRADRHPKTGAPGGAEKPAVAGRGGSRPRRSGGS